MDPDAILKSKIVEFVMRGDFGLASGTKADGSYDRVWFQELVAPDEVAFEAGVHLLGKSIAEALKTGIVPEPILQMGTQPAPSPTSSPPLPLESTTEPVRSIETKTLHMVGNVPPELWNRLGTKVLPKLRTADGLTVAVKFTAVVKADGAEALAADLRQILQELGLADSVNTDVIG